MIRIFLTFTTIFSVASGTATEYAPKTRRGNVVDTIHGYKIADPYRWLENQESPEVRAWLARQDAWFKQHTNKLPLLKDINTRLTTLKAEGFNAAPTRIGNRY